MTCTTHIPKRLLQKALRLILQLVPIQQTELLANKHGTAIGAKMAVAFANIFIGEIEKQILNESARKPLAWKRYIDDIISFWHSNRDVVEMFIEQANKHINTIQQWNSRWDIMDRCHYLRHHHLQGPKTQHRVSSQ